MLNISRDVRCRFKSLSKPLELCFCLPWLVGTRYPKCRWATKNSTYSLPSWNFSSHQSSGSGKSQKLEVWHSFLKIDMYLNKRFGRLACLLGRACWAAVLVFTECRSQNDRCYNMSSHHVSSDLLTLVFEFLSFYNGDCAAQLQIILRHYL